MHHCPDRERTEMSVCRKVGPLLSWMDGPSLKAFVTWTSIRKKWMFIIHLFPLSLPTSILTFPRSATYPNCLRHDRWLAWNQPSKYCFQFFPLFHHFIQLPPFLSSPPLSSSPSIHPSLILQTGEMTVHCFVLLFFSTSYLFGCPFCAPPNLFCSFHQSTLTPLPGGHIQEMVLKKAFYIAPERSHPQVHRFHGWSSVMS